MYTLTNKLGISGYFYLKLHYTFITGVTQLIGVPQGSVLGPLMILLNVHFATV